MSTKKPENENRNNKIPFEEDNYTHNINQNRERKLDRRAFMKTVVGAAGVFAVSTLPWGALAMKELATGGTKRYPREEIAGSDAMKIGDAVEFSYPSYHDKALLIKLGENEYKAYHNACTHLQCPVFYDGGREKLVCPCHHGFFSPKDGAPLAGPPRRPLPEISLEIDGDKVFAIGVKRYEA